MSRVFLDVFLYITNGFEVKVFFVNKVIFPLSMMFY